MQRSKPDWLKISRISVGTVISNLRVSGDIFIGKSAGAVEDTDCFSAESQHPPPQNEYSGYDSKQSNGEVLVMLELWRMWSTPSLLSPSGPLLPGVVASYNRLSFVKIRLNRVLMLNWIAWNRNWLVWNWIIFWHLNCTHAKLNCCQENRLTEMKSLKWNAFEN